MQQCSPKKLYKSKSTIQKRDDFLQVVEPISLEVTAEKLIAFSVSTDSVVATAILIFDDSHSYVSLHWGDDDIEIINIVKLREMFLEGGGSQEPNTLKVQHVYRPPFDYGRKIVTAVTTDSDGKKSYDTVIIDIEQRYKLLFYQIVLEFPNHLDSIFETDSEIEANLTIDQKGIILLSKQWREEITTAPNITSGIPIHWSLCKSNFTREISYSDDPINIDLLLQEHDGIDDEDTIKNLVWDIVTTPFRLAHWFVKAVELTLEGFDQDILLGKVSLPLKIHPHFGLGGTAVAQFKLWPDGEILAKFNYELKLIIPLDQSLKKAMTIA